MSSFSREFSKLLIRFVPSIENCVAYCIEKRNSLHRICTKYDKMQILMQYAARRNHPWKRFGWVSMDDDKFSELIRNMRLMRSNDSNFAAEKFLNFEDLSEEQKTQMEKEFGKKKKTWMENSLFYNYYDNDDSF